MGHSNVYTIRRPAVVSIVASKSNTGKTTLIEGLIKTFKDRNYTVGVLKHDSHNFETDKKGKDSYRFSRAGAENVIIASFEKLTSFQRLSQEKKLEDILNMFKDIDIVLIEGFKKNKYPKIEVHRKEVDNNLLYQNSDFDKNTFIAVASNEVLNIKIPVLDLNNVVSIADFIETKFLFIN